MSGVGFKPTPTIVDQKPQIVRKTSLESGTLDHSPKKKEKKKRQRQPEEDDHK